MSHDKDIIIGGDPYNSADTIIIEVLDLPENPAAKVRHEGMVIEYNDEYWQKVWGMRLQD